MRALLQITAALIISQFLSGCLTQRTVTEGGQTVSQQYVIKRPIKDAIENSQ